jgi:hypothetical protein
MVLNATLLLCPFIVTLNIFTLKDTAKTHYNNTKLNILDNAPLAVYQATLARHWLVMGLKTDNSRVDAWLSKMEVAIENITSLIAANNLAANQLVERKVTPTITTKWCMFLAIIVVQLELF